MKMKKALAIMLAAAMTFAVTACGGTEETSSSSEESAAETETSAEESTDATEEAVSAVAGAVDYSHITDVKIAVIGSASGGDFWGKVESGFDEACAARGWTGEYMAPSGNLVGDAGILDLAETALTQGYNVICPVIQDTSIFEDFLNRANEAGVLVVAFNSNPGEEYVIAQVGIDNVASGEEQGLKIAEFANEMQLEEINYVVMYSSKTMVTQVAGQEAAVAKIEENFSGTLNFIDDGESNDNPADAQEYLGATYLVHPEMNVIVCMDQYSTIGAASFIKENSLEGQVIVCGLSLGADALLNVKEGALSATSSVDTVYMGGEQLCGVVEAIINGEEFEYKNYPPKIWVMADEVDAYAEENGIDLGN